MAKERKIIHVDMDAFFASIEIRDTPALRGRPVVVGGTELSSRGVVSTCSYEARACGVHSAMPLTRARLLCPEAVFLPVDMTKYVAVSRRIMKIIRRYSDLVEQVSLDEAYLDVTNTQRLFKGAGRIGRRIKAEVETEERLPLSVGISVNKVMAKIASKKAKPGGIVTIPKRQIPFIMKELPVSSLPGVGPKMTELLQNIGIRTAGEITALSADTLEELFGRTGLWLRALARGEDGSPVTPFTAAKGISRESTFPRDTADYEFLRRQLRMMVEEVAEELRADSLRARTVTVKLRFGDFKTITRSKTFIDEKESEDDIFPAAEKLLKENLGAKPLRLLGVGVSQLRGAGSERQLSFFTDKRHRALEDCVDRIKRRFGRSAITRAATVPPKE